ncbi:MAG: helix-turn-helix domain-containing protein [Nevskiales bacterium]|nr:helix-turn-helix domain-containing protein [Nevskiales bacterium]
MAYRLSTDTVAPKERFSYWVDAVCNTYMPIDCSTEDRTRPMPGSIQINHLGELDLTITQSAPQVVSRTRQHLSRHDDDTFQVSLQLSGKCVVHQSGREAVVEPGDVVYYDCAHSFDLHFLDPFEIMIAKVPRSLLASHVRNPEELTAMTISAATGTGALLRPMFERLCSADSPVSRNPAASQLMVEAIVCTTVAGLCTLPAVNQRGTSNLGRYHIERARSYARQHLGNPRLGPAEIAAALSISESYLYRLFQSEAQSLTQFIWSERLQACRHDLSQPRFAGRSITEIALSRGFSDVAHFSRCFRKRFGMSPSQWRQEASEHTRASSGTPFAP